MQERRHTPRFTLSQMIELSYGREEYHQAVGVNISSTGLLCKFNYRVEPSARVYMMIAFHPKDESRIVRCEGVVQRVVEVSDGNYEVAVRFTDLSSTEMEKLETLISELEIRTEDSES